MKLIYDLSDPVVNEHEFEQRDWMASEFGHLQGVEVVPPNMPEPQGMGFVMRAKVDADHAADTVTRRSRTGFLVYLNSGIGGVRSKQVWSHHLLGQSSL